MNPFSRIISGTMTWGAWGAKMSTAQMQLQIEKNLSMGITTFDHADIYGGYTTLKLNSEQPIAKPRSQESSCNLSLSSVFKCL